MQNSFMLPPAGATTPETIKRRRKMADILMDKGMDSSPIQSWTQGAARMANALVGGYASNKADAAEAEGRRGASEMLKRALLGDDKSSLLDAASNPWMDNNSLGIITNQWEQMNQPPPNPELKDLGGGQFYQYDPRDPSGSGEMFTPDGYQAPPPDPTDDMREYQFYTQEAQAAGQQPVDFFTWQKAKTPQTNITNSMGGEVGTIPQGFELFTDPNTGGRSMRPIAGGPAAIEQDQYTEKMDNRDLANAEVGEEVVLKNIDHALKQADSFMATGLPGQMTQGIGGMPATKLAALIAPIKANIGFDRLQRMRQDSPTGGALGQVAVQELDMLQATLGSLDPNAGPEILKRNLSLIKTLYQRALERNAKYGKGGAGGDGNGWTVLPNGVKIRKKGQ